MEDKELRKFKVAAKTALALTDIQIAFQKKQGSLIEIK
ncbi:MAG: hypothetical protein LBV52_01465 [Spirochaetaceae bacterium]|nr:hypothetical protein [Spirochaetaceae bacterium]